MADAVFLPTKTTGGTWNQNGFAEEKLTGTYPPKVKPGPNRLETFNQLVLDHQNSAFRLAFCLLGDEDEAADITQNAFLTAYRQFHTIRGSSFRNWLLTIIKNACYDEFRRRKRQKTISLDDLETGDERDPQWVRVNSLCLNPEQEVERNERLQQIRLALDSLKHDYRTVVVLIDVQGMDYEEAARIIGCPVGTVKSRLARARQQLIRKLRCS
jgi:RNA polymerase sigma-70 factor (ECF subfamily)